MRHPEVSEFEFAEFHKEKVVKLAKEIIAYLEKEGVTTALWAIQPWQISFKFQTSRSDSMLTDTMFSIYQKWDQVGEVGLASDHSAGVQLLQVHLNEKWFKEEEAHGPVETRKKKHPEDRDGFTV